jgi:hypothetical protein
MSISLIVIIVFFVLFIISGVCGEIQEREKRAHNRVRVSEERKAPPVACDYCGSLNKPPGGANPKVMHIVHSKLHNKTACSHCYAQNRFCKKCASIIASDFAHIFVGDPPHRIRVCQQCFEDTGREWCVTRDVARQYHRKQCAMCEATVDLHVHHKTYSRECFESLDQLIVLCQFCHSLQHNPIHQTESGRRYVERDGRRIYVADDADRYRPLQGDRSFYRNIEVSNVLRAEDGFLF